MKSRGYWEWRTPEGTIAIVGDGRGRFDLKLDGRTVGNCSRLDTALEDAVQGAHIAVPSGLKTSDLGPPRSFAGWTFVAGK